MRVALLTPILAPYRVPAFRALAETPGLSLRVFVNAASEFDRSWAVDSSGLAIETLPTLSVARADRTLHLCSPRGVWRALARQRPDVVVSAELGARSLGAWLYCRAHRVPFVLWLEPTRLRNAAAGALRRTLGPLLLRRADAVVVPGSEGRRAVRALGVPDARCFVAPNCHDAPGFEKLLASLDRDAVARDLRPGLGTRARVALVAGRLFPVKGIDPLLAAWDLLPPDLRRDWTLLFVGDGPLAGRVREAVETHRAGEILRLPAVQPAELVELYAAADLLVFPSLGDVWGIAVNEAMACGLPVLCSSLAGAAHDLVAPDETGWLADPRCPENFAAALRQALTCGRRRQLGAAARERVAAHHPDAWAGGVRSAIAAAVRGASAG